MFRIGHGFDIHNIEKKNNENKKFILAGILIDPEMGIDAHSDGDTLIHAVIDSILGALSMDDIGDLFPNTDQKYFNADSIHLLKEILSISKYQLQWNIFNLDIVIILEKPKLKENKNKIKKVLADIFQLDESRVGVKAKTFEDPSKKQVHVHSTILLDLNKK